MAPQEEDEEDCAGPMSLDSNLSTLSACAPCPHEAELKVLRSENMWLRRRLNEEVSSWRLCRVSSPLTGVRFGASLDEPYWHKPPKTNGAQDAFEPPDSSVSVAWDSRHVLPPPKLPADSRHREGDGWRWWPTWCPCCRRPIDISTFRDSGAWEGDEKWSTQRAVEAQEAVAMEDEPAGAAVAEGGLEAAAGAAAGGSVCAAVSEAASGAVPDLARAAAAAGAAAEAAPAVPPVARYAYVAALWGYKAGFVLGALVLGAALRKSGTKHDLVLVHTDDIPASACELLAKVWRLWQIEYVDAHEGLFSTMGSRFDGVFTKLHALGLTEYAKVLVLDLDVTILSCLDELFELPAPAAMGRSIRGGVHGERLDGRHFFVGEKLSEPECEVHPWGQGGGINAGLMLLAPSQVLYERILKEVRMPVNPAHIPGNGPEQDFLSRLFAPWWTHVSVVYNYQLHRAFHALEFGVQNAAATLGVDGNDKVTWTAERLAVSLEEIKLIHFSGNLKMWDRDFSSSQDDDEFADQVLRDCSGDYCRIWQDRKGYNYEYQSCEVRLEDGAFVHCDPAVGKAVGPIIERCLAMATGAARMAVRGWQEALHALPQLWPALPALPEMLKLLRSPRSVPGAAFEIGAKVEVWARGDWFKATVRATHVDNTVSVEFDVAGFWGCGARHVPPYRVRLQDAGSSDAGGETGRAAAASAASGVVADAAAPGQRAGAACGGGGCSAAGSTSGTTGPVQC